MDERGAMSKRPKQKHLPSKPTTSRDRVPSAVTVFRFSVRDDQSREIVDQAASKMAPILWLRDGKIVEQIRAAETPAVVLDLAAQAHGLAEAAWMARVRQFGLAVAPLIAERLKASRDIPDEDARDTVRERLIAALRWTGWLGARALRECFAELDEYGQSLACVVLGLLHDTSSAGLMWDYVQKMKSRPQSYFVGALWGLIDLKDERAGQALAELLHEERSFYELYGLLALAGDARAVVPLIGRMLQGKKDEREDAAMALVAVAQRMGRAALIAEFEKMSASDVEMETLEATADGLLTWPVGSVHEYFELYFRGLRSDDLNV
jgi:hypothetical protein